MRQLRAYRCADCGAPTQRKRGPGQSLVCVDCGVQRMRSQALRNAQDRMVRRHQAYLRYLQWCTKRAA